MVDSKAVMRAYLDAEESAGRRAAPGLLGEHARLVRDHLVRLAAKAYREQFQPSPEFVVMFLPGENFFRAAIETDPALFDDAIRHRVVLASPLSLISLLWGGRAGVEGAAHDRDARGGVRAGQELYKRVSALAEHFDSWATRSSARWRPTTGRRLARRRVLPAARRMKELGAVSGEDLERARSGRRRARRRRRPSCCPCSIPRATSGRWRRRTTLPDGAASVPDAIHGKNALVSRCGSTRPSKRGWWFEQPEPPASTRAHGTESRQERCVGRERERRRRGEIEPSDGDASSPATGTAFGSTSLASNQMPTVGFSGWCRFVSTCTGSPIVTSTPASSRASRAAAARMSSCHST